MNTFDELMMKGVEEFGSDWYVINRMIADVMSPVIDITQADVKKHCLILAYRFLKKVNA